MNLWKQVWALMYKDLLLEWRQKYTLGGILLYAASTIMVVYMSLMQVQPSVWSAVFWIIMLFASVNAVAKSFMQESEARMLYYYTIASPTAVLLAKLLYNILLLSVIAAISLMIYMLLLGNPVDDLGLFILAVALGALGFSLCFTLISAIASKSSGNATLMPILSFPVVIPILGLLIIISKAAVGGVDDVNLNNNIGTLLAIDGIMLVLSFVLFPYLWRD